MLKDLFLAVSICLLGCAIGVGATHFIISRAKRVYIPFDPGSFMATICVIIVLPYVMCTVVYDGLKELPYYSGTIVGAVYCLTVGTVALYMLYKQDEIDADEAPKKPELTPLPPKKIAKYCSRQRILRLSPRAFLLKSDTVEVDYKNASIFIIEAPPAST